MITIEMAKQVIQNSSIIEKGAVQFGQLLYHYCISFVGPMIGGTVKPACRNNTVIWPR